MRNPVLPGAGCSLGAAIPPEYWTFPQAPKLSTALLGRNRSGSGRGWVPDRHGQGAIWGQPPNRFVGDRAKSAALLVFFPHGHGTSVADSAVRPGSRRVKNGAG